MEALEPLARMTGTRVATSGPEVVRQASVPGWARATATTLYLVEEARLTPGLEEIASTQETKMATPGPEEVRMTILQAVARSPEETMEIILRQAVTTRPEPGAAEVAYKC